MKVFTARGRSSGKRWNNGIGFQPMTSLLKTRAGRRRHRHREVNIRLLRRAVRHDVATADEVERHAAHRRFRRPEVVGNLEVGESTLPVTFEESNHTPTKGSLSEQSCHLLSSYTR